MIWLWFNLVCVFVIVVEKVKVVVVKLVSVSFFMDCFLMFLFIGIWLG